MKTTTTVEQLKKGNIFGVAIYPKVNLEVTRLLELKSFIIVYAKPVGHSEGAISYTFQKGTSVNLY